MTTRSELVMLNRSTAAQANAVVAIASPLPVVVGIGNFRAWLAEAWTRRVSTEGALWLLMMDGLFLIPLIFAAFFYPKEVLIAIAIIVAVSGVLIELLHVTRTHRFGWGRS